MRKLSDSEIFDFANEHQDWLLNSNCFEKKFTFINFFDALSFVVKVGMVAEKLIHHPDILLHSYKYVTIKTFTHEVDGITDKDIELINQIDRI